MRRIDYLITVVVSIVFATSCTQSKENKDYLKSVLNNIEQVKSASYYSTTEGWVPGDTAASAITHLFVHEYDNPSDTTIGASFVDFLESDTTLLRSYYDGNMRA
ncbi:MAG: hypothetical protein BGO34_12245 [Bacteroidia bacterium 44-10]|nr:MAG: hypothetical protein BGO34_12245 [Bacteroidia bacterium 44-10]